MSTAYHAKYFACELTRIGGAGVGRLSRSLFDACVDLNPHQIEAALFAFRSPVSKGVLLADEVGLGKTIEAGLVLCQFWAERRRRILVICPASIRKQWALELAEKFNLPTVILDVKEYRDRQARGVPNPFEADGIVITSTHFASARATDVRPVQWDLVVVDEAHKLRNAYRPSNRMGQNIRWALENRRKVLLTATPLQNSLVELYGISTIIECTPPNRIRRHAFSPDLALHRINHRLPSCQEPRPSRGEARSAPSTHCHRGRIQFPTGIVPADI
ncbi:hypothetical protein NITMOv2_2948 [Nitrospira moscoviensis]|uniref:Helicase ATP-binding domain-containing protein n=1 Tax=Nitrospira moscoviensis TaxID=42253 RepID=A0A0K2GEH4_NITMO|nr:DEAD/DEAH box helicase [Nitrospira moscoviensis]ALA59353.1 hypothetical protein NITMOv2_2948 [Nitrospira moscoviensis]